MRRNFAYLLFFLTSFLFVSVSAQAAAETYTIDPNHTYVLWHINHFGFSNPSGKWVANGTLIYDETKPQDSKVNVTIHTSDIITGVKELDKHLQGELFFNTKKFPDATFVSDKIHVTGKTTAIVHGMLTVRGISKPVALKVTINKIDTSIITNKKTIGFTAATKLNRSEFGITTLAPGLSDEVKLEIEGEAFIK